MSDTVKTDGLYAFTTPAIMIHPTLFEPKKFKSKGKESGEPKYGANFVMERDSADLAAMKTLAAKIARAKWPDVDFKTLHFPFASGDKLADARKAKGKSDGEFQRGKVILVSRSKFKPRLSGKENGAVVDYDGDAELRAKGKFFFGAEALAQVNFVAYDKVGANPPGVAAYLNLVYVNGKGTRLGGGAPAAEVFKGYMGSVTDEDPTAGASPGELDDEIPF